MSGVRGQCRCGQVQFSVTAAPLITMPERFPELMAEFAKRSGR
jgi:hypothetical protein